MTNFKGIGIIFIKKSLQQKGPEFEQAFLNQLSAEDRQVFASCLAFTWIPIKKATYFFTTAVKILYPNDPLGLQKIGKGLALDNINGVYKILMRFATVPFVAKQAASFWKTYHQAGKAKAIAPENTNQFHFIVEDYPTIPKDFQELLRGYIQGVIETTGAKGVTVHPTEPNISGFEWLVTWA